MVNPDFFSGWREPGTYIIPAPGGEKVGLVDHEYIEDDLQEPQFELCGCAGNLIEEQLK